MDRDGTKIQATFFNEAASKFDQELAQDKVYTWSNGRIGIANKRFTSIKNDYCLTFESTAAI